MKKIDMDIVKIIQDQKVIHQHRQQQQKYLIQIMNLMAHTQIIIIMEVVIIHINQIGYHHHQKKKKFHFQNLRQNHHVTMSLIRMINHQKIVKQQLI